MQFNPQGHYLAGMRLIPAGMDPSWFIRPPATTSQARCTNETCECNAQSYSYGGDKARAVAQALYIDGNWHRYQLLVNGSTGEPPGNVDTAIGTAAGSAVHAAKIARAACEVMVAQYILIHETEAVLRELRNRLAIGRARGFDQDGQCIQGDEAACTYQDDLRRYRMLQTDIGALRLPRAP